MGEVEAMLTFAEVSQGFEHGVKWLIETHSFHRMLLIPLSVQFAKFLHYYYMYSFTLFYVDFRCNAHGI